MELTKAKWFKTTGGKIGIVVGALALITGVTLVVRHFVKKGDEKKLPPADETKTETTTPATSATTTTTTPTTTEKPANQQVASDLPNGGAGCGPIRKAFDRVYDYVKCNNVWYTISKDKIKIPKWKSLADNKTASDLLNNKYPN